MAAGYSGTPLAKKLGFKEHDRVFVAGAPDHYRSLLEPLHAPVEFVTKADGRTDLVHLFVTKRAELANELARYRRMLRPDAAVWVSWPKKSSKVRTDVTEDVIREAALPLGWVDVKVCAVDDVWSGLELVVRLEHR